MQISAPRPESTRHIVVVTGTDTAVGKTWVCCAIARALTAAGKSVVAIKPIETGCGIVPRADEDGVQLARATGQAEPGEALVRLASPVTPALAADRAQVRIDVAGLARAIRAYAQSADVTIIEGAGGALSPLTWDASIVDLARAVSARAIVVAVDRLGTINHVALTLRELARSGVDVLGIVLVEPQSHDASTGTNADAIARVCPGTPTWRLPRTADAANAARAASGIAALFA